MANVLLPSRFVERIHRLLLGIQPMDTLRLQRMTHAVEMRVEPTAFSTPLTADQERWLRALADARTPLSSTWKRVARHATSRYVLHYERDRGNSIDIRIFDPGARIVPRRLRIPVVSLGSPEDLSILDALPVGQRSRTPHLYPGAMYETSERVTGLRGRVVVNSGGIRAVRWPRIEVRPVGGGAPVAWAHGDEWGEFLLILPPDAIPAPAVQLPRTLTLQVTAFGRLTIPASAPPLAVQKADTHWDLPLETLGAPNIPHATDNVSLGRAIPADYDGSVTQVVSFSYSEIISSTVAPFQIS